MGNSSLCLLEEIELLKEQQEKGLVPFPALT